MKRNDVEYITRDLLVELTRRADQAPRGRTNHNFHESADPYQRMLNVVQPGSYIRPHRHRDPGKGESFVVLQGEIAFFHFAEDGTVTECKRLGPKGSAVGVDLVPGVWHAFLALEPDTVVFEGKNGPYDPATDKQFPDWAPEEGAPEARAYQDQMLRHVPSP